jgi:RNA polymerase sigma-70 factor (ECF subfamily)
MRTFDEDSGRRHMASISTTTTTSCPQVASTEEVTDNELFDAWCGEEPGCGAVLIRRHIGALRGFFRSRLRYDIDELVQQTLFACVEGRAKWRREGSFRSWLLGIANRVFLGHLRRRTLIGESALRAHHDPGPSPESFISEREDGLMLRVALARLSPEYRGLIELYFDAGWSGPRIAATLGIPEGTVRARPRRASRFLRRQISCPAAVTPGPRGLGPERRPA